MKKSSIGASQHLVIKNSDYAAMVLDKAIHDFQVDRILKGIDQSLESRNKEDFLRLTEELKMIRMQSQ
ncbi:phosphoesterase [Bacillus sp. UMB0899]|nr:phosphoesterase [Bacillus sp. UMB0899]